MTMREAREWSKKVTQDDLDEMFRAARRDITNWEKPTKLNSSFSIGWAFNRFSGVVKVNGSGAWRLAVRNALYEFGDYLPGYTPRPRKKSVKPAHFIHEDPN